MKVPHKQFFEETKQEETIETEHINFLHRSSLELF